MQIRRFWARGYRSLRDVEIDNLGPFNVFYGPNGAGKSNVLAAIELFVDLLGQFSLSTATGREDSQTRSDVYRLANASSPHTKRDRCHLDNTGLLTVGAELVVDESSAAHANIPGWPDKLHSLVVEFTFDWARRDTNVTRLEANRSFDLLALNILTPDMVAQYDDRRTVNRALQPAEWILEQIGASELFPTSGKNRRLPIQHEVITRAYTLIGADRTPHPETPARSVQGAASSGRIGGGPLPGFLSRNSSDVAALLSAGKLKEGLLVASRHPDPNVRSRYRDLQALLQADPLNRPGFDITHDPASGEIDVVETKIIDGQPHDVPLDLVGLGLAQVYRIVAQCILAGTFAVGIEEPEAHLHAPTSGMKLRQVLSQLVESGPLTQLFIATHSNLFDLDPDGYFDVSHDAERGTIIERKPLPEIDRAHLYEPGPAKHALQQMLDYLEADTVVFRRPDGAPVSAGEMLDMLQRDDPVAKAFTDDIHGAALLSVQVTHEQAPS